MYRTGCAVCMLQSDTEVSAWLIQTAQSVRSNLHSTLCASQGIPFFGWTWGWGTEGEVYKNVELCFGWKVIIMKGMNGLVSSGL